MTTLKRHFVVSGWTLGTGPSGATRRVLSILRALPGLLEPGERVTVLYSRSEAPPEVEFRVEPVDVPARPTWLRALAETRRLRRTLEDLGADLLDLGTLPVPKALPCPVALTLHDLRDLHPEFARRPSWIARRVLRGSVTRSRCVIVPSEFTASELRRQLGHVLPPIEVVPNGVDERLLGLEPCEPRGRPYFLHVGHLEARKNLMMLLSAYATFVESADEPADELPALVLVGRDAGEARSLHDRAVLLDLTPHVHFEDDVPDDHLLALYTGATAVLVPSRYEGFGLPALEALAAGVPALVADAGALPEVVGSFAQVLPNDDPQAWASAMAAWRSEPRRPEAIRARKNSVDNRTWTACARGTLEAWRRACAP